MKLGRGNLGANVSTSCFGVNPAPSVWGLEMGHFGFGGKIVHRNFRPPSWSRNLFPRKFVFSGRIPNAAVPNAVPYLPPTLCLFIPNAIHHLPTETNAVRWHLPLPICLSVTNAVQNCSQIQCPFCLCDFCLCETIAFEYPPLPCGSFCHLRQLPFLTFAILRHLPF